MTTLAPLGLHHVTAIASDPGRNVEFYTRVLGLRLVKQTVNFDDPGTYHLYYGDFRGSPSSLITFFPWKDVERGRQGTGLATSTAFSVPGSSLSFWHDRLRELNVRVGVARVDGRVVQKAFEILFLTKSVANAARSACQRAAEI